ncbi:MAG: hypothetical protein N2448_03795 [Caloramator sp.]|nr:hypothetical protein [Caloramator sp.]
MVGEREKLIKTKEIILKMANGINPVDNQPIDEENFMNDPRMIRCMFYVANSLEKLINDEKIVVSRPSEFIITPEQKSMVKFPDEKIGVNEFSRCINSVIDRTKSKCLTGVELNKNLKKIGILSEKENEHGRKTTVTNEKFFEYGFETIRASFNGKEYDKVVINNKGKKFLLDNLKKIMSRQYVI